MNKALSGFIFASSFVLAGFAGAQDVEDVSALKDAVEATPSPNIAVLRALDKITARITELNVPVGGKVVFGTLEIEARYCRSRPPEETPETFAYLDITDKGRREVPEKVFSGWMFASSPAVNAMEHPVYDVWVINCKMGSGPKSLPNE